jgi:hypothetical protein
MSWFPLPLTRSHSEVLPAQLAGGMAFAGAVICEYCIKNPQKLWISMQIPRATLCAIKSLLNCSQDEQFALDRQAACYPQRKYTR